MKLKIKDQNMDTLPLLRIGNKTPMEGVTETKFGAEQRNNFALGKIDSPKCLASLNL